MFSNRKILLLLIIAFAALFASCGVTNQTSQTTTSALVSDPVIAKIENDRVFSWAAIVALPEGMTQDDYKAVYREYLKSDKYQNHSKIISQISTTNSWVEAHNLTQKFIGDIKGDNFAFIHQQYAGASMLRNFFMYTKPTPESQEAMAYYLEILKSYKSFQEINLIVQILPKMKGYWSDEKIAEYARLGVGDYNTRRHIPIIGKAFSAENYFAEQAQKQLIGKNTNISNSVASMNSSEVQQLARKIRADFSTEIPIMLDRLRAFDVKRFNQDWLIPKMESIVLMGILAEGSSNR